MGFWHTGYIEFHEPSGLDVGYRPSKVWYSCLVRQKGWLRASDLASAGVPRVVLTRMTASGQLERAARGLYRLPDSLGSEHEGLTTVATKVPQAVFCLLSALQFHRLTTQLPRQVWIAMPRGSHAPRIDHPPTRWFSSRVRGLLRRHREPSS